MKPSLVQKRWWVVDASQYALGRLAARVAILLRGKHKTYYTPHINCGDHVIVVNAKLVKVTGKKLQQEKFYWHSGYPGGIKEVVWRDMLSGKYPERLVLNAIRRMLPKESPLATQQFKALHVYGGCEHPHGAQNPEKLCCLQ